MTIDEMKRVFDENQYEQGLVENLGSIGKEFDFRPDLHAFRLLDQLCPTIKQNRIIAAASHDQIFLDINIYLLAERATDDQIVDLIRCGVHLDEETESLAMFV